MGDQPKTDPSAAGRAAARATLAAAAAERRVRLAEPIARGLAPTEITAILGVTMNLVRKDAHKLGLTLPRKGAYDKADAHYIKAQRQELERELGVQWVRAYVGDDPDGDALPRYHAAYRLAVLDADQELAEVRERLRTLRRRGLDHTATSRRPDEKTS